ncbi:DUF1364 domain-containing protein [Alloalcanivorax sp. C16-1]|uniref:DUF1364 domain-containing protein n=1 Tax=Alloalcanivorax sp. C16-1 TaxID=3390051 RepID=UPI003970DE05
MKRTPLQRKTPLAQRSPLRASARAGTGSRPKRSTKAQPRASKIRSSAKGQPCQVRLPGICNHDPATVVAAHLRIAGTCGVGLKPSDLLTVRACDACHAVIDGRARAPDLPVDKLTLYVHEAHCRTLVEYEKEGLIHAK